MEKITGFMIFICLLIFGVYFLDKGKLEAASFTAFMSVTLICGLAFYGFDRLKELDLINLKVTLSEIKKTKKDIEKEVDLLLVTMAEANISSAIETDRMQSNTLQYEMIRKREKAKELLKKAGWNDEDIKAKTDKINIYILGDIAYTLTMKASLKLRGKKTESGEALHLKFQEDFPKIRQKENLDKNILDEIKECLKKYGISPEEFASIFEDMEYFIETGQLKRPIEN